MDAASGRKESQMSKNGEYAWGVVFTVFGGAGIAEHITSGRGSFLISAIVFSIGFAMILWSYVK